MAKRQQNSLGGDVAIAVATEQVGGIGDEPVVVVAIARSAQERARLAALVDDHVQVLLASSYQRGGVPAERQPPATRRRWPRRHQRPRPPSSGLLVDSDGRFAHWGNRTVALSPLEHDLLCCLLEEVGRTWSYQALHRQVWGHDQQRGRCDVQSVVKRLRAKLRELDSPLRIDAVRGVGLRLVETVAVNPPSSARVRPRRPARPSARPPSRVR